MTRVGWVMVIPTTRLLTVRLSVATLFTLASAALFLLVGFFVVESLVSAFLVSDFLVSAFLVADFLVADCLTSGFFRAGAAVEVVDDFLLAAGIDKFSKGNDAFDRRGCSRTMSAAGLSLRRAINAAWRNTPSAVHSANSTSQTSTGCTHCTPRA